MPRRVNNLFKIHKAKLVPSVRLGALVELHQQWIWLPCALQQPRLRARETARTDLACGKDENPPVRKTEHATEQNGGGGENPTTQGQVNHTFPLFCCAELRVVFCFALTDECSETYCSGFILIFTTPSSVVGPPEAHCSARGRAPYFDKYCHYQ